MQLHPENFALRAKYSITAWFYDILDYPWERTYKRWRPTLLGDTHGNVLEAGAGTGRNFPYYPKDVSLTAIELSNIMCRKAQKRATKAACSINLKQGDATQMPDILSCHYDWVISTFMCCVIPDELQPLAIKQFHRILKPGGKFKLLEMVYSKEPQRLKRQKKFAPFVEKVYGARFDRNTLEYLKAQEGLEVTSTRFLKDDTYLLIEGKKLMDA